MATPGEREPKLAWKITIYPFIGQIRRWEILPNGANGALEGNTERMRARSLEGVKTPPQCRARFTTGVRAEAEVVLTRADVRALTSGAGGTSAVAGPDPEQSVLARNGERQDKLAKDRR